MPSTCSCDSFSRPQSCGLRMGPLGWWAPSRRSRCRRERECVTASKLLPYTALSPAHFLTLAGQYLISIQFYWNPTYQSQLYRPAYVLICKPWQVICTSQNFQIIWMLMPQSATTCQIWSVGKFWWPSSLSPAVTGMVAAEQRGGWVHPGSRVWGGAVCRGKRGDLEPWQQKPGVLRVQGLHCGQPSAAGWCRWM